MATKPHTTGHPGRFHVDALGSIHSVHTLDALAATTQSRLFIVIWLVASVSISKAFDTTVTLLVGTDSMATLALANWLVAGGCFGVFVFGSVWLQTRKEEAALAEETDLEGGEGTTRDLCSTGANLLAECWERVGRGFQAQAPEGLLGTPGPETDGARHLPPRNDRDRLIHALGPAMSTPFAMALDERGDPFAGNGIRVAMPASGHTAAASMYGPGQASPSSAVVYRGGNGVTPSLLYR